MQITLQDHASREARPSILRDRVIPRESLNANEEHQVDLAGAVRTPQRIDSTKEILRSLLYQQVPRETRERTEVALRELHADQMPTNRSRLGPLGQSVMQAPKESCDSNLGIGDRAGLRGYASTGKTNAVKFSIFPKQSIGAGSTRNREHPLSSINPNDSVILAHAVEDRNNRIRIRQNPLPADIEMLRSGNASIPQRFSV